MTETLQQEGLGTVNIRVPGPKPKGLVLLFSGRAGWDAQMSALADSIAEQSYVVAGIDSNVLPLQADAQIEKKRLQQLLALGALLEKRHHVTGKRPVIAGYGSGATLVYRTLTQATAQQFHAGIGLDFCPDEQGSSHQAVAQINTTWFVFQRAPACNADTAAHFVQQVEHARLASASADASSTTASDEPWQQLITLLQWLDPGIEDQLQAQDKITGVPLIELPNKQFQPGGRMVILVSGDGGWAELDRTVAKALSAQGIAVVGWDSLSYFWRAKTPEQASSDLERVIQHYQQAWLPGKITLVGYSFGANVLPFMASRLPAALRTKIDSIVLLNPEPQASFEFHLSDWLTTSSHNASPLLPEITQLRWTNILCIYGMAEKSSACPDFAAQGVTVLGLKGDHHFNGDYPNLTTHILHFLKTTAAAKTH